jgi:hypothetical protein
MAFWNDQRMPAERNKRKPDTMEANKKFSDKERV